MHKSRLAGLIIDCETDDLQGAADFWAAAIGAAAKPQTDPGESNYIALDTLPGDPYISLQRVDHASRVHIDIETDDVATEVARLEALGAKRIEAIRGWVVMEAPTGQRFCVVPDDSAEFDERANCWN